jgi:hypothetical protein
VNALRNPFNPLALLGSDDAIGTDIVRNAVREIIGSYHHPFDIFLEAFQNAVDACETQFSRSHGDYTPEIDAVIDLDQNVVEISDNGTGLSSDDIKTYFFTPFSSRKRNASAEEQTITRGNKGVGATFLAYGSECFEIWSVDATTGERSAGALIGAATWLRRGEGPPPNVTPIDTELCEAIAPHGTTIRIVIDAAASRIGELRDRATTPSQWGSLLRLFTAVGYIDLENENDFLPRLRVRITVVNNGNREAYIVAGGFLYPHELTRSHVQVSQLQRGPRAQLDVRQRDKDVLFEQYSVEQVSQRINEVVEVPYYRDNKRRTMRRILANHKPRAYVAFTYSSSFWDEQNDRIWGVNSERYLTHGYLYATKHQRIGEQNRLSLRFRTGDFNRFFMVLELDLISADIGRKSLGEEFETFANELLYGVRKDFYENIDALRPSPSAFSEEDESQLEDIENRAIARPRLGLEGLHLSRVPDSEQDVVALFFDLLGENYIRGYDVYATHTAQKYDGVGRFELRGAEENYYNAETNRLGIPRDRFENGVRRSAERNFLEFKLSSDGLITDLESGAKRLSDIKWLICWEIGRRNVGYGAGITEILEPAHINQREYYGVTHILTEGADKVHVLCLRSVIDYLLSLQV